MIGFDCASERGFVREENVGRGVMQCVISSLICVLAV